MPEFWRTALPPNPGVEAWIEFVPADSLFASVFSLAEIRRGIDLLALGRRRRELEVWLESDLPWWFGKRILPVTKAIANRWGALDAQCQTQGRPVGNIDGLLAATALEHNLVLDTRNVRYFHGLGVEILSPWSS